jgi:putative oxygen-independent coproporphyrinogen III oxidase
VDPEHLYVHAPFCARRCSYCDFAVTVDRSPDARLWLEAVGAELASHVRFHDWPRLSLKTLYVGGGTPSLFGHGAMAGLAGLLREYAGADETLEWTAEANPEHFSAELAADWVEAGVNRVSLGAQTFDPGVLSWMGRLHGPEGPGRAVAAARTAGLGNIGIDLIFGVPARLDRNWADDLDRAIDLDCEHVSLYGLTAEKNAPLGRWVDEGRETMADEEAYADEYLLAAERLGTAGYTHYEVSNFAKPGFESRHNRAYWTGAPYLGLGPGAHSYLPPRRFWNVRDWAAYRERILAKPGAEGVDGGPGSIEGSEDAAGEIASLERAWLGLRTNDGAEPQTPGQQRMVDSWVARGWAVGSEGRVRLTAQGWLLLDRLAVEFEAAP